MKWWQTAILAVSTGAIFAVVMFFVVVFAVTIAFHSEDGEKRLACRDLGGQPTKHAGVELCVIDIGSNEGTTNDGAESTAGRVRR